MLLHTHRFVAIALFVAQSQIRDYHIFCTVDAAQQNLPVPFIVEKGLYYVGLKGLFKHEQTQDWSKQVP